MKHIRRAAMMALLVALGSTPSLAAAKDSVRVDLAATTSNELVQDEVRLVFSASAQADSAAAVNASLTNSIGSARQLLGDPDKVTISTGGFHTYPVYEGTTNKITGWRGQADLVLSSRDLQAASRLADKLLGQLALSSVSFALSDQARRTEQARLLNEGAKAFRDKAQTTARAFGYETYRLDKLHISESGEPSGVRPLALGRASSDGSSTPALNLQPAKQRVSVTVSGSVELR